MRKTARKASRKASGKTTTDAPGDGSRRIHPEGPSGVSQGPDLPSAQAGERPVRRSDLTRLKEVLERSAAMKMIRRHMRQSGHREAWRELVGEAVARKARALAYRGGKLFVEVSSAALLQELSTFRKAALMDRLRQTEGYEGIVDIVFRHGGL